MISKDLLNKVKKIEIRTRRMVDEITAGAYHSVFKGSGIEFNEVREYTSDDDVRDIDWNVTAKTGTPHIKKYVEERELTVMLAVDISASGKFGKYDKTKTEASIELAALLAFSAIRNNDKVGLLLFTDKIEFYLPPKSGKQHVLRLIRELVVERQTGRKTDIKAALEKIIRILHKKTVVFLISDMIDEEHDFSKLLTIANRRHDLIAVRILDEIDFFIPKLYSIYIEDSESDEKVYFNANQKNIKRYKEKAEKEHNANKEFCIKSKVDIIDIRSNEDLIKPLMKFFRKRERMLRK